MGAESSFSGVPIAPQRGASQAGDGELVQRGQTGVGGTHWVVNWSKGDKLGWGDPLRSLSLPSESGLSCSGGTGRIVALPSAPGLSSSPSHSFQSDHQEKAKSCFSHQSPHPGGCGYGEGGLGVGQSGCAFWEVMDETRGDFLDLDL